METTTRFDIAAVLGVSQMTTPTIGVKIFKMVSLIALNQHDHHSVNLMPEENELIPSRKQEQKHFAW